MIRTHATAREEVVPFVAADGLERLALVAAPPGTGRATPGVVIIHGLAGPSPPPGPPVMPGLVEELVAAGLGTVRYLPRVYELYPDRPGRVDWQAEHDDAVGAARLLQRQPWLDSGQAYLLGMSLGGVAAPAVAQRAGGVAGIASWGATARPWPEYSVDNFELQLRLLGRSEADIARGSPLLRRWHDLLRDTDLDGAAILAHAPDLDRIGVTAEGRFQRSIAFWRQVARFAPEASYRGLNCRVLAVRGSADCCSHPADHESVVVAARAAGLEAEAIVLEGLDHGLRDAAGPGASARGDVGEAPRAQSLGRVVARWIRG